MDIAELHRAVAAGDKPPIAAWNATDRAARTACRASKPTVHVAGLYAVRAAYQSTALVDTDHRATLDAVTGNALHAHKLATVDTITEVPVPWRRARTGGTMATPIVELTRHAIRAWRSLAGLDTQSYLSWASVDSARQLMEVTGAVVTSAGLVFAFTMMSMVVSDLVVVGQVGSTISLGLLFDTLVIRSFMTPSIAAMMRRWFWWPQKVRTRPKPVPWPTPPRHPAETPVSVGAGGPAYENPTGPISMSN